MEGDVGFDNYVSVFLFPDVSVCTLCTWTIPSIRFISMSNSLPKTSFVNMIDIWLLFNLTIPFAEVKYLMNTT